MSIFNVATLLVFFVDSIWFVCCLILPFLASFFTFIFSPLFARLLINCRESLACLLVLSSFLSPISTRDAHLEYFSLIGPVFGNLVESLVTLLVVFILSSDG
uniref:Uncharacterized protein n=1 Tax=Cacopsylla melanoneura TaxID=428564 RepID=A0A8D8ZMP3_9HEMI